MPFWWKTPLASVAVVALLVSMVPPQRNADAAPPDKPATTRQADKIEPLKITLKDNGKTVGAVVGQEIVVSLEGKEPGTGWEVSKPEGKSVRPAEVGGSVGQEKTPPREFAPADDAADEAIGTYTWRYKAVAAGETTLEYSYVSPGGPKPIERSATRLVARMKVTIAVSK